EQVRASIRKLWPNAKVVLLNKESAWGAVLLARELCTLQALPGDKKRELRHAGSLSLRERAGVRGKRTPKVPEARAISSTADWLSPQSLPHSPTEQRNPRSMHLDKMSISQAVKLMLTEDSRVPPALLK